MTNNGVTVNAKKLKKEKQLFVIIKRLFQSPIATVGIIIFLVLALLAIFSPLMSPYNFAEINPAVRFLGPCMAHPCGTDNLGRDILTRILYGGRYSLSVGFIAVLVSAFFGVIIGSLCGYFGGRLDNYIMRFLDIFQAIPGMLLTIAIAAALGAGFNNTILALAVSHIPAMARITRSSVMKVRQNEFIEAAEAIGCNQFTRIFIHVLPNSLAPVLVQVTMEIANTILILSSLSYIGLGIQPPIPEWGAMLSAGRAYIRTYPYMIIFPGLFIAITVLALNLAGDGLRDALDPRLKD